MCIALFSFCFAWAQKPNADVNQEFARKINYVFQNIEKDSVPHGLLIDYAMEFTNLEAYNGTLSDTNAVHVGSYKSIY